MTDPRYRSLPERRTSIPLACAGAVLLVTGLVLTWVVVTGEVTMNARDLVINTWIRDFAVRWPFLDGMGNFFSWFADSDRNFFTIPIVIVTLLIAHPVVTKAAVKLVACRTVAGRQYLDANFAVSCDSDEYTTWALNLAVPLFALFTFGVPLGYALAMYRHVRKGTLGEHRAVYGFFFSGFRRKAWWFELWNTIRKSLFTISSVIFAPAGVEMQTWAALVLLLFYIVVFVWTRPYAEPYLNALERSALAINIVTLLTGLGLFINDKVGEARSHELTMALTTCIISANVAFALSVVGTLHRMTATTSLRV